MANKKIPERCEVPEQYKWNTDDLFVSDEAWQEAFDAVQAKIPQLAAYAGRLSESAATLYEYLKLDEEISEEDIRLMVDAGSKKGAIDDEESAIIQNVFEFDDLTAEEIATHRTDVVAQDHSLLSPHKLPRLRRDRRHHRWRSQLEGLLCIGRQKPRIGDGKRGEARLFRSRGCKGRRALQKYEGKQAVLFHCA